MLQGGDMTSPSAIQYGTRYHIFTRGNNRENLFLDEGNYHCFMTLYLYHVAPIAETYAYCLLRNHMHFFLRIKKKSEITKSSGLDEDTKINIQISPGQHFSNLLNAYAKTVNNSYHRTGSLFQHPFRRIPVPDQIYFSNLMKYIHRNPQHHGFVKDFRDWPFSSYHSLYSTGRGEVIHGITLTRIDRRTKEIEPGLDSPDLSVLGPLVAGDFM